MEYQLILKPSAEKELDRLPRRIRARVLDKLEELRPPGVVKLTGDENLWRIRVGNHRAVHGSQDDQLIVLVLRVAHRKDVYREM